MSYESSRHFRSAQSAENKNLSRRQVLRHMAVLGAGAVFGVSPESRNPQTNKKPGALATPMSHKESESQPELGIPWLPENVRRFGHLMIKFGNHYDVPPQLIAIFATTESFGDPNAVSNAEPPAYGLMQLWSGGTQQEIARKLGKTEYNIFDPATNIEFGTYHLWELKNDYASDDPKLVDPKTVATIAAAYNGGRGRADAYRASDYDYGVIPGETVTYIERITGMWLDRHKETSPTLESWQRNT